MNTEITADTAGRWAFFTDAEVCEIDYAFDVAHAEYGFESPLTQEVEKLLEIRNMEAS